jgi:hypothetical protein
MARVIKLTCIDVMKLIHSVITKMHHGLCVVKLFKQLALSSQALEGGLGHGGDAREHLSEVRVHVLEVANYGTHVVQTLRRRKQLTFHLHGLTLVYTHGTELLEALTELSRNTVSRPEPTQSPHFCQ